MNPTDDPIHPHDEHGEHLLDVLLCSGLVGAMAGGLTTLLSLVPVRALVAHAPSALPLAHLILTAATCAVALSGLAYLGRRWALGTLDRRVMRALPIVLLMLVPMIAPWTRLVVAFPRFVEASFAVSFATGLITLVSLIGSTCRINRVSAIFAAINACEYGMLSAGLALAGGPVALAGLAAAAAVTGLTLTFGRRVRWAAVAVLMLGALGLASAALHASFAPERRTVRFACGHPLPVKLRGAVVTIPVDARQGCRPVDAES